MRRGEDGIQAGIGLQDTAQLGVGSGRQLVVLTSLNVFLRFVACCSDREVGSVPPHPANLAGG